MSSIYRHSESVLTVLSGGSLDVGALVRIETDGSVGLVVEKLGSGLFKVLCEDEKQDSQYLSTGYVYAPYVPLVVTPIFHNDSLKEKE